MKIVDKFLEKGYLLSPELIDNIDEETANRIIPKLTKTDLVLDKKTLNLLTKDIKIKLIRENKQSKNIRKVSDFVEFYNQRLDYLSKILEEKIDSKNINTINKLSYGTEAILIGMVREVSEKSFKIEDKTGSLNCFSGDIPIEDDVVAVKGVMKKDGFIVDRIYYPDVPLTHKTNNTKEDCYVIFSKKTTDISRETSFIFTKELDKKITKKTKSTIITSEEKINLPNINNFREPFLVEINGVKVFVVNLERGVLEKKLNEKDSKKIITLLLKRRHFLPFEFKEGDPYLIEEIPDIVFVTGLGEPFFLNHKGITIISVDEETSYLVNLKNREVEEIKK